MTASSRRPLRIAVLGNLESIHTQRWFHAFTERGHDMRAISFYPPRVEPPGVIVHVLRNAPTDLPQVQEPSSLSGRLRGRFAPQLRGLHAYRYNEAGLKDTLASIAPDVLHAHFLVEHGFYGSLAGFHPYVVSAWGSDVFVAPKEPVGNLIARWTINRSELVTGSDPAMVAALRRLGAKPSGTELVRIGALEELFFAEKPASVNLEASSSELTVISTRALEPLYNIDILLRAFARVHGHLPHSTLRLIGDGSQRFKLAKLAVDLGLSDAVRFFGRLSPERVRDELSSAHVYVSVPSSDSMAASTMEAMARGAFPIVSDLPSVGDFIEHGLNGLLVSPRDVDTLANALQRALVDANLRRRAVELNRAAVEIEGRLATQVERLEAAFYRLTGIT